MFEMRMLPKPQELEDMVLEYRNNKAIRHQEFANLHLERLPDLMREHASAGKEFMVYEVDIDPMPSIDAHLVAENICGALGARGYQARVSSSGLKVVTIEIRWMKEVEAF